MLVKAPHTRPAPAAKAPRSTKPQRAEQIGRRDYVGDDELRDLILHLDEALDIVRFMRLERSHIAAALERAIAYLDDLRATRNAAAQMNKQL